MHSDLEAKRQELPGWVAYWQRQLDALVGGLELEVDPVGLPREPVALERFCSAALGAVRDVVAEVAHDERLTSALRARVAKVLVRNDEAAAMSRFDYDSGRRTLVVIGTPALRQWVDTLALQEFLRREL